MYLRSKLLAVIIALTAGLAAQSAPFVISEHVAPYDYTYTPIDMATAPNSDVLTLRTLDMQPTVTRYTYEMQELHAWTAPELTSYGAACDGSICALADNGFIYIGTHYIADVGLRPFIARVDASGDSVWSREYNEFGPAEGKFAASRDEAFYAAVQDSLSPLLVRLSSSGDTLWTRRVVHDIALNVTDLQVLVDGSVLLLSQTTGVANLDMTLHAFSPDGDSQWALTPDNGFDEYSSCVVPLANGDFIWCRNHYSETHLYVVALAYRYTADGEFVWSEYADVPSQNLIRSGVESPDGEIYLGGSLSMGADLYVLVWALGSDGETLWKKFMAYDELERAVGMGWTPDNRLLAFVRNYAPDQNECRITTIAPLYVNFTADPQVGFAPFNVQFTSTSAGPIEQLSWDIDGDGEIDATGESVSWTYTDAGLYDVTLTVTGADTTNSFTEISCVLSVVSVDDTPEAPAMRLLLSNPVLPNSLVRYSLPAPGNISLDVYDIRGRRVTRLASGAHAAGDHTASWDDSLPNGVYLLRLKSQNACIVRRVAVVR